VPDWHNSQAGPFDLWPTGLGFEYFYGFIGGDTSQWAPAIFENIKPIEPPHDAPGCESWRERRRVLTRREAVSKTFLIRCMRN
jgi:hypothetical protein